MSVTATVWAVGAALSAAGLRLAVRDGDITPPVIYLRIGQVTDSGQMLAGGTVTTMYAFVIPIRGIDNLDGDAKLLDRALVALAPLSSATLTATETSVTVRNDTWPCYRFDVPILETSPLTA